MYVPSAISTIVNYGQLDISVHVIVVGFVYSNLNCL
jgi:hypothetical protein